MTALEKQAEKEEKDKVKVDQIRASLTTTERKRKTLEEELNSTKPFDDLKAQEAKPQRQIEEDQSIADDNNA